MHGSVTSYPTSFINFYQEVDTSTLPINIQTIDSKIVKRNVHIIQKPLDDVLSAFSLNYLALCPATYQIALVIDGLITSRADHKNIFLS
jgi:hypothetical protein